MTDRPKVIFYAPLLEYPAAGGAQLKVLTAIKALNQVSELHVVTTIAETRLGSAEALSFLRTHSHRIVHLPSSRFWSNRPFVDRVLRKLRRVAPRLFTKRDLPFLLDYAGTHDINTFWIDHVFEHSFALFLALRRARPLARIVGDTCAVFSRFILREVPLETNPVRRAWILLKGRRMERDERRLLTSADVLTAVSAVDAEFFRSIAPDPRKVRLFSNVVDLADYRANGSDHTPLKGRPVLLLGSFGHANSPMDRAAKWMAEDVMPVVRRHIPDAQLYIVGRNADKTQAFRAGPGTTVVGQVPSMVPYLRATELTVVPLKFESGTRIKILESGAAGVPCVSTTLGAEGLDVTHEENILIADTTEDFAAAIVKILSDRHYADLLGQKLHKLVAERYTMEILAREGRSIIDYLGARDHR